MPKHRVLFLRAPSLLAEGIERLLRHMEGVEFVGPWDLDAQVAARLSEANPDIIVLAEEGASAAETGFLISEILEQHPDLPIVRVGMEQHSICLYTSRALPARTTELVELIRNLPIRQPEDIE